MEYYSAMEKAEILSFAAMWAQRLSKPDREKQISFDIAYMQNLKKVIEMNLYIKQKKTHKLRNQTYGYQRGKKGTNKFEG